MQELIGRHVLDQDTAATAMAWAGIVVFGVLGLVSGRVFYRGMFPPGR